MNGSLKNFIERTEEATMNRLIETIVDLRIKRAREIFIFEGIPISDSRCIDVYREALEMAEDEGERMLLAISRTLELVARPSRDIETAMGVYAKKRHLEIKAEL